MHAGRFMTYWHEANAVVIERREKRVNLGTRKSEDKFHTLIRYGTSEQLAASYICHLLSPEIIYVSAAH